MNGIVCSHYEFAVSPAIAPARRTIVLLVDAPLAFNLNLFVEQGCRLRHSISHVGSLSVGIVGKA